MGRNFQTRARLILEYCCSAWSSLLQFRILSRKNIHRAFTKRTVGISSNPNHKERCKMLDLESLWLRCWKANLILLVALSQKTVSFQLLSSEVKLPTPFETLNLSPKQTLKTQASVEIFIFKHSSMTSSWLSQLHALSSTIITRVRWPLGCTKSV